MAEVVATARRDYVAGNFRMVKAHLTFAGGANEWTPGLETIEYVDFTPTAATSFGVVVDGRSARFLGLADESGDAIVVGT